MKKIYFGIALVLLSVYTIVTTAKLNDSVTKLQTTQNQLVAGQLPQVKQGSTNVPVLQVIINELNLLASQSAHFKAVVGK